MNIYSSLFFIVILSVACLASVTRCHSVSVRKNGDVSLKKTSPTGVELLFLEEEVKPLCSTLKTKARIAAVAGDVVNTNKYTFPPPAPIHPSRDGSSDWWRRDDAIFGLDNVDLDRKIDYESSEESEKEESEEEEYAFPPPAPEHPSRYGDSDWWN